jgi:hypothetical protein
MISFRQADLLQTMNAVKSVFFVFAASRGGQHYKVTICCEPDLDEGINYVVSQLSGSPEMRNFNMVSTNPNGFDEDRDIEKNDIVPLQKYRGDEYTFLNRVMSDLLKDGYINSIKDHRGTYRGNKGRAYIVEVFYQ